MKPNYFRWIAQFLMGVTAITLAVAYAFICAFIYLEPTLPTVAAMKNNDFAIPLRVYTSSGELISQIGEQRRIPVKYEQIPDVVKNAFIAAEDDQFFEHHGFDWKGIVRALFVNVTSGERQGASTITMQAARSAFFTQEQKIRRKLQEVFVTQRLESEFSKQEILALYLNVIFFGHRSYGVAAAAETYFGKQLEELTLGEAAILARVPQWPSRYNPISDPEGSTGRRAYVLRRMRELNFIDVAAESAASKEVVRASLSHRALADVDAAYVAEMVRQDVEARFGAKAIEAGYKVYTTIDGRLQKAANLALRDGLVDYTRRHGWRGPISKVELTGSENDESIDKLLDEYGNVGNLKPAIVLNVAEKQVDVRVKRDGAATIEWAGLSWAKRRGDDLQLGPEPKTAADIVARGDVVYVLHAKAGAPAELAQIPEAQSALIALDPNDGAILSLVGGFDFFEGRGKFNRVIQARRQPGSGFKPFMYAAAMAANFTPATMLLDAPIVMDDPNLEEVWRPKNSGGGYRGPMRLREAVVQSRNLVSIRLLQALGIKNAIDYAVNFGFPRAELMHSNNLTLALGSFGATPLEVASGFAVFANGGFRVEPYFIERIEGPGGQIVYTAEPKAVCADCVQPVRVFSDAERAKNPAVSATFVPPAPLPAGAKRTLEAERAISPQVSFIMNDIMKDVITRGTGRRALALGRSDLRGKTGTTNDNIDTWFNGFNNHLVASVWVGMDVPSPLGAGEEGARTAAPIWVDYMREALRGVPESRHPVPEGVVEIKINARTGGTRDADIDPVFEYFRVDMLPSEEGYVGDPGMGPQSIDPGSTDSSQAGSEPIF